jgi:hypothetical protein
MLSTDAYAYLNVDNPICAWATYRGVLVTPPAEPGFLSVWTAGLLGERWLGLFEQFLGVS